VFVRLAIEVIGVCAQSGHDDTAAVDRKVARDIDAIGADAGQASINSEYRAGFECKVACYAERPEATDAGRQRAAAPDCCRAAVRAYRSETTKRACAVDIECAAELSVLGAEQ